MAGLLARAVEADPSGGAGAALDRAARATGAEVAAERGDDAEVASVLADRGYEPYQDEGVLRLRNCPFGRLAEAHRDLVCHANLAFMEGLLEGLGRGGLRAVLEPRPGRCCVAFV
jgi:predicted ArsR family transcriptional regulator